MSEPTANPFTPPTASIDQPPQAAGTFALAERGQRLVAVLIDVASVLPSAFLLGFAGFLVAAAQKSASPPPSPPSTAAIAMIALGVLSLLGVAIYQCILLSKRGQTIGKRWMAIKIVKLDGSAPGFVHAVLLRVFVNGLIGGIPKVGAAYSLVDILMIFRADRRCAHDLVAGTRVVKAS